MESKLVNILQDSIEKKKLTASQARFAIECFERVLNGDTMVVRLKGDMIRVDVYQEKDSRSV